MEWRVGGPPPPFALRQTVALAVHLQDVDVVGETVEQGAGQPLAAEDFGPFVEWQIAGHQGGAALVALAEHPGQQLRPALREGHKAEFVDDQQLVAGQLLLQAQQPLLVPRLPLRVASVSSGQTKSTKLRPIVSTPSYLKIRGTAPTSAQSWQSSRQPQGGRQSPSPPLVPSRTWWKRPNGRLRRRDGCAD